MCVCRSEKIFFATKFLNDARKCCSRNVVVAVVIVVIVIVAVQS